MVGGLNVRFWVMLWDQCCSVTELGWRRDAWPDGGGVLSQPAITVKMFDLVTEMAQKDYQWRTKQ